jgi:hypothetical protein
LQPASQRLYCLLSARPSAWRLTLPDRIKTLDGDEADGVKVHAYLAEIIQQVADEAQ